MLSSLVNLNSGIKNQSMRGLTMFISDIRNAESKEEEKKRVEKELAHIRKQFGDKSIDGYNLKKYVWKLLYCYMLGYDIEIGHMEALKLITSNKFSEKNAGYMACSTLWNENTEFLKLMVQSVRKDLSSVYDVDQCLALSFVCNIGGNEFAEALSLDIAKLVLAPNSNTFVRKKAALCLLRLFRKNPECLPQDDGFPQKFLSLLDHPDIGVLTALMSLLLGLVSHSTVGYEEAPLKAIQLLTKLAANKDRKTVYRYYLTICPWLQVKCLRVLQYFPPPKDVALLAQLSEILKEILTKTIITKNINKNNADHSILFEAINVIIHLSLGGVKEMQDTAIQLLGRFIAIKEPNFRYLGLETMTRLAAVPGTLTSIREHHEIILQALQDGDVSIRKRGLDLIYVACDKSNALEIVPALLVYLQTAVYEIREELVLKIAILAEKFATDLRWYLDVILQLLTLAGDYVSDDIWYRVVQIVTNHEELQDYAATKCFQFLNGSVHENGVKVAAYILGEFADQIKNDSITGPAIFSALHSKFPLSTDPTKALLLSAYVKLSNTWPELRDRVNTVFASHRAYVDTEIQQRACEYYALNSRNNTELLDQVFDVMPNFSDRESLLEKRIRKQKLQTTDRDVWSEDGKKADNGAAVKAVNGSGAAKSAAGAGEESEEEEDEDEEESEEEEDEEEDEDESDEEGHHKAAGPAKTMDILGAFDVSNSSSGSRADLFAAQKDSAVLALYNKDSGVLYESAELQLGMKLTVENNNSAKLILFYGNKCPNSMKNVTVSVPESDQFSLQVRPVEAFEVPPKKQIQQYFLFHCFKPFKGPVPVTIKFQYANQNRSLVLQLPLLITRFVVPTQIEAGAFVGAWQKYGNEVQAMRKLPSNPDVQQLIAEVRDAHHFFVVSGVEKSTDNFVATGTFHTATKAASGAFVTMPCLLRVETKPNMNVIRLTIHSGHPAVSEALLHSLTKAFNASEN